MLDQIAYSLCRPASASTAISTPETCSVLHLPLPLSSTLPSNAYKWLNQYWPPLWHLQQECCHCPNPIPAGMVESLTQSLAVRKQYTHLYLEVHHPSAWSGQRDCLPYCPGLNLCHTGRDGRAKERKARSALDPTSTLLGAAVLLQP